MKSNARNIFFFLTRLGGLGSGSGPEIIIDCQTYWKKNAVIKTRFLAYNSPDPDPKLPDQSDPDPK